MSEGNQKQENVSQEETDQKKFDKANTNAWKEKQELKKQKVKQGKQEKPEKISKADKKKNKKTPENDPKVEEKPQPTENKEAPKAKQFDRLKMINTDIPANFSDLLGDQEEQTKMTLKAMNQFVNKNDTVLFIGDRQWDPNCEHVSIPGFADSQSAELVCRYQDISFFMESELKKIFCWGKTIFSNGSAFVKKGALNIIFIARERHLPIVISTGSWNYCGFSPLNEEDLENKYGENIFEEYDWIPSKMISLVVLEVGGMHPSEVSASIANRYKPFQLDQIKW